MRRLLGEIAGADATDLGGTMSLNVGLTPACPLGAGSSPTGLVLRVHRSLISRARLLALQAVRQSLAGQGLGVPAPLPWQGATLFRCGERWAELEPYLPGVRPEATPDAYAWMFRAMGALHRALSRSTCPCPALRSPPTAPFHPAALAAGG